MYNNSPVHRLPIMLLLSAFAALLVAGCGTNIGSAGVPAPTPNSGASTVNDPSAAVAPTSYLSDTISLYKPEEDYIQGAPVLGLVVDRKGTVIAVEPKGAAAQAGIAVGDSIVALDGTPFAAPLAAAAQSNLMDVPAMQDARSRVAQGQPLKLTLSRAGQERTLDVQPANRVGQPGQATPTPVPADQLYM